MAIDRFDHVKQLPLAGHPVNRPPPDPQPPKKQKAWCEMCGNNVNRQLAKLKLCGLICAEELIEDGRARWANPVEMEDYADRRDRLRVMMGMPVAHVPKPPTPRRRRRARR